MKNFSFQEILREKMQDQNVATADSTPRIRDEKIQTEILWNSFFNVPFKPAGKYPQSPRKNKQPSTPLSVVQPVAQAVLPTITEPVENWIFKSSLDEDGKSKWNLFETTIGVRFEEKITAAAARSAFRKYIKKVHPDLTREKSQLNFSTLVKIKDEFIRALDKQNVKTS
jgi:hypothetical protein